MSNTSFFFVCILATMLGSAARAKDPEKGSPAAKPPTFQVPKGWKSIDAGLISAARFRFGEGDRIGSMTVTGLKGDGGGLAANINRWRAQVGLESLAEKDALATAKPIKVDGISGHSLDLTGPEVTGKKTPRILVVVVKRGDRTWFFKLEGSSSLVASQNSAFDRFLKSVRFQK
jgi:hypothetical protein